MKPILELINEHEDICRNTMGRDYKPLSEKQIRVLTEVGYVLHDDTEIASFVGCISWLKEQLSRERRKKQLTAAAQKQKREKEREEEFQPKLLKWIDQNVASGSYLKMKGCRDGDGYREVFDIDEDTNRINCYKVILDKKEQKFIRVQMTDHSFDKVMGPIELVAEDQIKYTAGGYIRQQSRVKYTSLRKTL